MEANLLPVPSTASGDDSKGWCPKCACFQPLSNALCEKCGVSMSWHRPATPMSLPAKCFAGFLLLIFASLAIAIFGDPGAAIVVLGLLAALSFLLKRFAQKMERRKLDRMAPEARIQYLVRKQENVLRRRRNHEAKRRRRDQWAYGPLNPAIICPHCQTRGTVRTKRIENKVGVSGSKATAALLTAGVSLLVTGLSRKQQMTAARCGECKSVWQF